MNKWWVWVTITLVLIIAGLYLLWITPQTKITILKTITPKSANEGSLPDQLNESFDPSINEPRFMIVGLGISENSLQLEYAFPPSRVGQKVESILTCEQGISLRESGQTKLKKVELSYALSKIMPENMPILLTGLCQNETCQIIIGKCNILLN